jgi:LmbE family N-acetylglucosaminyl deacetylase
MSRARPAFSPILGAAIASGAALTLLGYMIPMQPARADLLIVAPHPDDDLITSAGVILRARQAGETVWVLFMTNGDIMGVQSGLGRQDEAVEALDLLDVPENNIIFLGYPDGSLEDLRSSFLASNTARPASNPDQQTQTFGARGLGSADYHRHIFGAAADNNGTNVRTDLTHVLSSYHPAHIFVTAEYDQHPDHRTSYRFVMDAVEAARAASPSYNPTIHKTIVWNDFSNQLAWPAQADPTTYFTEPPNLQPRTGLSWTERESLDVPLQLQLPTLTENLKWRAIDAHTSQGGNGGYIGQWVHKDEFFWTERHANANRPPVPNAGTDLSAGRGARVTLNGSASLDPDGDTLSYQWRETGTPSVTLAGASSARPSFTVPNDAAQGAALVFELRVGDGTSTSVADAVTVRVDGTAPPEPDAGPGPEPDAGNGLDAGTDAGSQEPDGGATGSDAGVGQPDAMTGSLDANLADDAGSDPDAMGTSDAGPGSEDAGEPAGEDASEPAGEDASEPAGEDASAAAPRDAGRMPARDAGPGRDAGKAAHGKDDDDDDSGCSAVPGKTARGAWWPLLLAGGWFGARRRRRTAQYGS